MTKTATRKTLILFTGQVIVTRCVWNHLGVHCPDLSGKRWFGWGDIQNSLDFS